MNSDAIQTDIAELGKSICDHMATKKDIEPLATEEDIDGVRDWIANAKDEIQEQIAGASAGPSGTQNSLSVTLGA